MKAQIIKILRPRPHSFINKERNYDKKYKYPEVPSTQNTTIQSYVKVYGCTPSFPHPPYKFQSLSEKISRSKQKQSQRRLAYLALQ